jgi:hypothetical protein
MPFSKEVLVGYYIETGQPKNKAAALQKNFDALDITVDEAEFFIKEGMGAVVCVVDNGPFEAAAYCHNLDEFRVFNDSRDTRPRRWLLIEDVAKVHAATGYRGDAVAR